MSIAAPAPARHDLLRLTGSGWAAFAARDPARAAMPGFRMWADRGHPVMRRRGQPGDRPDLIPVAVAFPETLGRLRIAFELAPADIASSEPPPCLREALPGLPVSLRTRAGAVLEVAAEIGLTPRLFGSAMWAHVTGLPYLHDCSDLDLLWNIRADRDPAPVVARLEAALRVLETTPSPRLDGEIVISGRAVNWRELGPDGPDQVMVKTPSAVALMPASRFLARELQAC